MRYISLIIVLALSLLTISLSQNSDHSSDESHGHGSEHSSEHKSEESDHHSDDDHHANDDHHSDDDDHHANDDHHSNESSDHHSDGHDSDTNHHSTDEASEHGSDGHHSGEMTEEHGSKHSSEHDDHHSSENTSDHHGNSDHHDSSDSKYQENTDSHHSDSDHVDSDTDSDSESNDGHEHSHHSSKNASGQSANKVMLGENILRLYPLLSPQGELQIIVQSDAPGYTTSVKFEDTSLATTFDEAGLTQVDLETAKQGYYYLTFRDTDNEITVPVSVYKAFTPSGKLFTTIFAPSPSLSSRGLSEVFIYNVQDGENQHQEISMNYSMVGMQHSTDDLVTALEHEHFDGLKSALSSAENAENMVLESAMSNRSAVSFSMVGDWQFKIMIEGETLAFNVAMLDQ